jgi:YegS/Rv2252/BmrU family lipid kinase
MAIISKNNLMRLEWLKSTLGQVFPRLDCIAPRDLSHLRDVVRRSRESHPLVIAVGGDGTLHQVLQHIDLENQVLGLLPFGTGNDLARVIGCPTAPLAAAQYLQRAVPQPIDIIDANGIRVHNSAGFGIDTATIKVRERNRGLLHSNYNLAFLWALRELKPLRMRIDYGSVSESGDFWWVLAMNNRDIGKGTRIAPRARFDDGLLDMLLVREMPKLSLVKLLPKASKGRHLSEPGIVYEQLAELRCELSQAVDYLVCDGEMHFVATREVRFRCQPGALRLLRV